LYAVSSLGYKASAEQFGPVELLDFSVHAEEVGFDSVVVSDHFQPWRHTVDTRRSRSPAGALGAKTERVMMGTSVVTADLSVPPVVVAQAMGTLRRAVPQSRHAGHGSGESLNEVAPLGIEWPDFRERWARLREAVR